MRRGRGGGGGGGGGAAAAAAEGLKAQSKVKRNKQRNGYGLTLSGESKKIKR